MIYHLIVFNIREGATHEDCLAMIEVGKRELSQIPGVLDMTFGTSVLSEAKYRYTLNVVFENESVINTYRDHPLHVAFADNWFRPLATDRITTDYNVGR